MTLARRLTLTGGPYAPTAARLALAELSDSMQGLREKLRLLVTELVSNGVKHGPASRHDSLDLLLSVSERGVRVEVSDAGEGFEPVPVGPSADLTSGWGLYLVDALADRWGVARGERTRVWFELFWPRRGRAASTGAGATQRSQLASATAAVRGLTRAAGLRERRLRRQARLNEATVQDWLRRLGGE